MGHFSLHAREVGNEENQPEIEQVNVLQDYLLADRDPVNQKRHRQNQPIRQRTTRHTKRDERAANDAVVQKQFDEMNEVCDREDQIELVG